MCIPSSTEKRRERAATRSFLVYACVWCQIEEKKKASETIGLDVCNKHSASFFHLTSNQWRTMQTERTKKYYPSFFSLVLKMFEEKEEHDCFGIRFLCCSDGEHEGCDRRMDAGVYHVIRKRLIWFRIDTDEEFFYENIHQWL